MEGTLDSDRFVIARMLGRTVGELEAMPMDEYHRWRAFLTYESALRELAKHG